MHANRYINSLAPSFHAPALTLLVIIFSFGLPYARKPITVVISFLELMAFLLHVTGKVMVSTRSIQVDFLDDSEAITAHTCSSLIVFPRGAFTDSFEAFCAALKAVISSSSPLSFNMI